MNTIASGAAWVPMDDVSLASLCDLLGCTPSDPYRVVGHMSNEWYQNLLDQWTVGGQPPTPAVYTQAGILGRSARLMCGLERSVKAPAPAPTDSTSVAKIQQLQDELDSVKRKLAAAEIAPAKRIKLANVLDQGNDAEISGLNQKDLSTTYTNYAKVMGGPPSEEEEETTGDQLSSLKHTLDQGLPPYADFAVFGQFGNRLQRKLKLVGLNIQPDGTLTKQEVSGPPSHAEWEAAYKVLRTALIGLDVVCASHLDLYKDHIQRRNARYGQPVWLLIYQADVRARREHMERLRRKLQTQHDMGGTPDGFDAARPWKFNSVWKAVVEDESFWLKQLREPALLLLAKTTPLHVSVATTSTSPSSSRMPPQSTAQVLPRQGARARNTTVADTMARKSHNIGGGRFASDKPQGHRALPCISKG